MFPIVSKVNFKVAYYNQHFLCLLKAIGLCILFVLPVLSHSQKLSYSSSASLADKVYLQLDNKAYTKEECIWFKAIVTDAAVHIPGVASGVLYVELIDPYENIVDHKLIRLDKGIGKGFFQLYSNYTTGYYQIRAYTEWNKNFGENFFFKAYLLISDGEGKMETNPIANLIVEEGQNDERRLKLSLSPFAMDSFLSKNLTVLLSLDEKKDTISLKKNKTNEYLLDYSIPLSCRLVTVKLQGENNLNYSRTIALDTSFLDVQFLPESGELVNGLSSVLGIKAIGYDGRGRRTEGEITGKDGRLITTFTTNTLGMGVAIIEKIDSTENYIARIQLGKGVQRAYQLPKIAAKGNILSVKKEGNQIFLKSSSSYLLEDSIMIQASVRGAIYYHFKGKFTNGIFSFAIPANLLPEGIVDFTLMVHGSPVAERLYFNQRKEARLSIAISTDKKNYTQREETKLSVEIKDKDAKAVPASLSVLAFNKTASGSMLDNRENILSYFLLSSDLRGEIESPGYYFTKGQDKFNDLDALILTQGWRKYNYQRDSIALRHFPEPGLTVSGNVKDVLSGKKAISGTELTLMTFGKESLFAKQKTDSNGRFSFPLYDEDGGYVDIVIQSANKSYKLTDYQLTLDKRSSPDISFDHSRSVEKPDTIIAGYIKKALENKRVEDAFIMMQEVVVKSYVMTPERKKVADEYGPPNTVIGGDEIRAKDAQNKYSYGLYSILKHSFRDKITIINHKPTDPNDSSPPFPLAMIYNSSYRPIRSARAFAREDEVFKEIEGLITTLVVVDGIPATWKEDYQYRIPFIPVSEIKSVEIIENAKNFSNLLCLTYRGQCDNLVSKAAALPTVGNIIAIYTYSGKGLINSQAPRGINTMKIPVFSTPKEFYVPRYENLKPEDWQKPDVRNLLHWQPELKADNLGKASLSIYNSDNIGTMQVIIEAISEKGEIGYQELNYETKKK
jgi:hypothetical protein